MSRVPTDQLFFARIIIIVVTVIIAVDGRPLIFYTYIYNKIIITGTDDRRRRERSTTFLAAYIYEIPRARITHDDGFGDFLLLRPTGLLPPAVASVGFLAASRVPK